MEVAVGRSTRSLGLSVNIVATIVAATISGSVSGAANLPGFEEFPARPVAIAKPAPVRLASREAKRFRTVLREGAQKGPNFAGHYTIVSWGCGTACTRIAIVDAQDGDVTFPPQLQPLSYFMVTDQSPSLQYRLDSNLLVATGAPMDRDKAGVFYYRWTGRSLKQLKYVPKEWER
jgi:hypothetical protein